MGRGWTHLIHRLPLTATLRDLLHAHQDNVMTLPVLDSGILLNINSPADYRRLLKLYPDADASAT
jgi:CTP:molybdopterin cytidylyltransferase MocA